MRFINDMGDGTTWPDRMLMISIMVTAVIVAAAMAR